MEKVFGAGRVSNAPVESFFKILKHSILQKRTNLRPADFLLKLYDTIVARIKAGEYGIQQNRSKKRGRRKNIQVDTTCEIEQWKRQGSTRGTFFRQIISVITSTDIRCRLNEKLQ